MKASELMIGDIVRQIGSGIILEIEEIKPPYIMAIGELGQFHEDTIEPIPLTPEILEKNGFTHSFGDSDFYDYEKWEKKVDDKTIRVIKDRDGCFCRVDDNKLTRSMGIVPAVHTMQKIIRIGGIEKTIEL